MSWLGLADQRERRFSLRGIGADRLDRPRHPDDAAYLLTRGTLILETRMTPDKRPHYLFGYSEPWPDPRNLSFQAIPGGGVSFIQVEGGDVAHAAIQHQVAGRTDLLRITFSWDALNDQAQLTVERPETDQVTTVSVEGVRPIPLQTLRNLIMGRGECYLGGDVVFAALSDSVEPVGPMPRLSTEAMIATPWGYKPVGQLARGDTVLTRNGDVVPVLHRVDRTFPARGSFAPLRLRAPYFGLLEDVVVAPQQKLVIDGSDVEYLFNEEAVLVPARHLLNGFSAERVGPLITEQYCHLILPTHEAVVVSGTAAESLYIGRLCRKPDVLRHTLLKDLERGSLPEHARTAFKELKWYDAVHLAQQRVA